MDYQPDPLKVAELIQRQRKLMKMLEHSRTQFVDGSTIEDVPLAFWTYAYREIKGGSRYDSDTIPQDHYLSEARNFIEYTLIRTYVRTRNPLVYFDPCEIAFVATDSLKSEASIEFVNNRYIIEFSTGLYLAIQDAATFLLSDKSFLSNFESLEFPFLVDEVFKVPPPELFPRNRYVDYHGIDISEVINLGKEDKEYISNNSNILARSFEHLLDDSVTKLGTFFQFLPICPQRKELASVLIQTTIEWIFRHEEAHLRLGHVTDVSSVRREIEVVFDEDHVDGLFGESTDGPNISQVEEWMADRRATNELIADVIVGNKRMQMITSLDPIEALKIELRTAACGIWLANALLDKGRIEKGLINSHPPPNIRFLTALFSISTYCKRFLIPISEYPRDIFSEHPHLFWFLKKARDTSKEDYRSLIDRIMASFEDDFISDAQRVYTDILYSDSISTNHKKYNGIFSYPHLDRLLLKLANKLYEKKLLVPIVNDMMFSSAESRAIFETFSQSLQGGGFKESDIQARWSLITTTIFEVTEYVKKGKSFPEYGGNHVQEKFVTTAP